MSMIKCNTCKVERQEDEYKSKIGRVLKTCSHCRQLRYQKSLCEHKKPKSRCKDCGGKNLCPHNKPKHRCSSCGTGKCIHNKNKSYCLECGKGYCIHDIIKSYCTICNEEAICIHDMIKYRCKICSESLGCEHGKFKSSCKICRDPIKITIRKMVSGSKDADKKKNRYNADLHVDKCFIKQLIFESTKCYYCEVEMQFVEYNDTLCTLERLDNNVGHSKNNCVLACMKCNKSRVGQKNKKN